MAFNTNKAKLQQSLKEEISQPAQAPKKESLVVRREEQNFRCKYR